MKYDFTTLPDRHGRDSIAVDGLGKGCLLYTSRCV